MQEFLPDSIGSLTLGSLFWDITLLVGTFVLFVLLAGILNLALSRIARGLTRRRRSEIGQRLIQATYRPITLLFIVQGFLAVALLVSVMPRWRDAIELEGWLNAVYRGWAVLTVALVAVGSARVASEFMGWYSAHYAVREGAVVGANLMTPLRRVAVILIYALAALVVMDLLGIAITPLIAGLGIGGIAVALAVQPTLANFFAGTYLAGDRVVRPGDFVELENGVQGYVQEVGWRSTRLRTPYNNLVVIPNSRLADSILTNYSSPQLEIGVLVMCGVSYSSDMDEVERLAREVAVETVAATDGADKEMTPWFGFENFGDSNVDFWLWVQAKDRLASFLLRSELIKGLHRRFTTEGISINYPMRRLIFPDNLPASFRMAGGAPAASAAPLGPAPPEPPPEPPPAS